MKKAKPSFSRRDFLKTTLASTAALAVPMHAKASPRRKFTLDTKGLPTTVFGRTGMRLPRVAVGCGSRFKGPTNSITAPRFLEDCLDRGFCYWDCAANYGTEHLLGEVVKDRRSDIWLSSKVQERNKSAARQVVEQSFANLKTDYIDMYNIHSVDDLNVARNMGEVFELLEEYRKAGDIGYIGFSGHSNAAAMRYAVENYDFDHMIVAMNEWMNTDMLGEAVPAAACKGMGISLIKAIRPRENNPSFTAESLIRYALSLEHVNTAVIGMGTLDILEDNTRILHEFEPMKAPEMDEMTARLEPFFAGTELAWKQPTYHDGVGGWH